MKLIFILGIILICCSCGGKGTIQSVTDNIDNFDVQKLFKKDKCTVYRFWDMGDAHYFTDCGETISSITEHHGKTQSTREENIQTK